METPVHLNRHTFGFICTLLPAPALNATNVEFLHKMIIRQKVPLHLPLVVLIGLSQVITRTHSLNQL